MDRQNNRKVTLASCLVATLKLMQDSEDRMFKNLDTMIEYAHSAQLKQQLQHHQDETQGQIERLQKAFEIAERELDRYKSGQGEHSLLEKTIDLLKSAAQLVTPAPKCHGMQGIIEDGNRKLSVFGKSEVVDDLLVESALQVELFEVACYESSCTMARELGLEAVLTLMNISLSEERSMAEKMRQIEQAK